MNARRIVFAFWLMLLLPLMLSAKAASDYNSLAAQIRAANSSGSGTISLSADITLTGELPAITSDIRIDGAGHSISGDDQYRIFVVSGGTLKISDLIVTGGRAPEGQGGGAILLRDGSRLKAERASFQRNRAENGGAILAVGGTLEIRDSRFKGNCAEIATFTLIKDAEAQDLSRTDGEGCDHVDYQRPEPGGELKYNMDGGAIRLTASARASIDASVFTENRATFGGAISTASPGARLHVERSSFLFNHASVSGGAIGTAPMGGGATVISGSSFVKNSSDGDGGAIGANKNRLEIANSTFSQNNANSGGALEISREAVVTITHATFVDNTANIGGDAISKLDGQAYLRNSLISGDGEREDCIGVWDENIGNLSTDGTCADRPSDDPRLGDLTGEPAWYPLRDRSPAIDYAQADFCLERDQRGSPRPQDGGCDIGAIEARSAIAAEPTRVPPLVCSLAFQIIAANRDQPAGGCPAGSGVDTITIERDITLYEALPAITSHIIIEGNGHSIDGDKRHRIFDVDGGRLAVKNLTMQHGRGSTEDGGAIRLLNNGRAEVEGSRFIDNQAEYGGAIFIGYLMGTRNSSLRVKNSLFINNSGSAIFAGGGSVSVSDSSFVRNSGRAGGGIGMVNPTRLEVSNSSFIRNFGGAIGLDNGVSATLTHITIHGPSLIIDHPNSSAIRTNISHARLRNSVLTGSLVTRCARLTQNINNFIADNSCDPMLSGDAMLQAPDEDSTFVAPLPGSPLIGAGHRSFCTDSDQLGNRRAITGRCDIGAIELPPVIQDISSCLVTTTHGLNFRDAPNGKRIGTVPQATTLATEERTQGWFQVEHNGATGWISADYVKTDGDCA